MKKIPFDIDKAKAGALVGVRMGATPCVNIVCYDLEYRRSGTEKNYPILAIITDTEGKKHEEHYGIDGSYIQGAQSTMDLVLFEDENKLTEFEQFIQGVLDLYSGNRLSSAKDEESSASFVKTWSAKILSMARRELKMQLPVWEKCPWYFEHGDLDFRRDNEPMLSYKGYEMPISELDKILPKDEHPEI